ncbi:uncharacterized protein K460DRAFT_58343 [Cucurbitaria berberidis CBS 394.84]|uniref:WSC domain-containing protein n=1 Tax=Cucurbitaria berberidis CBS 394.84 TaxID=1168544 RepID=A0A9P4GL37_9PLEO|nr:uncharacterized protein K460DRAFT_58343 [Cucurbitaria berberidis CBS 394.84]KAF1847439.1 hypothetical protein K460DRAFT_58343 [Cucurbitaria berberidis CBS 394.84]
MERRPRPTVPGLVAILALFLFSMSATADFTTSYCSNQNTGSTDTFNWTWQSNGKCTDHCNEQGTFAFAVIKYTDCWCTNYIPAQQQDTSGCMVDCPGFPDEKCGDKDKDLFIYIKLKGSPSGTQGASQATSAAASSAAPPPPPSSTEKPTSAAKTPTPAPPSKVVPSIATSRPESVIRTASSVAPTSTVYPSLASTSSTPTPQTSTTLKAVPTTAVAEPMTSYWVVTESGAIVTRTVVVSPSSVPARTADNGGGTNVGAIVGGVVGGIVGLLALVGIVIFALWRRRKQQREHHQGETGGSSGITRNTSTMSKAGLLGNTAEKDIQYPPQIMTNFSTHGSRHDGDSISPTTGSERRYSQPLMIDSRLDPRAVLTFHGANISRESLASIDDSRDYGRQLNVRNPDPDHRD